MATPTQIGSAAALLTVVLLGPRVGSTGLVFGAVGSLAAGMLYKSLKSRQQQDGQNSTENSQNADGGVSYPPFEDRSGVNPLSSTGTTAGITVAASSQGAASKGSKKPKKEKKAAPEADEWDFSDEEGVTTQPQKKSSKPKQQPKKEAKPVKPTVTKPTPTPKTVHPSSTSSDEDAAAPTKKNKKAKKKSSTNASSTANEAVPMQPAIISEADAEEGWQPVLSRKKRRAAALLHSGGDDSAGAQGESVKQNGTTLSSPVVTEKETVAEAPTAESVKVETGVAAAPVEQNPDPTTTEATAAKKKKKKSKGKSVNENGSTEVMKPASPAAATANGDNSEEWTVVSRRKTRS